MKKTGHGGWPIDREKEKQKEAMRKLAGKWWPKDLTEEQSEEVNRGFKVEETIPD